MAVQRNQIVDSCSSVHFVKQFDCKCVHVVSSLHEEDAVQQVEIFLELTVLLDLVQKDVTSRFFTLEQLANNGCIDKVTDGLTLFEFDERKAILGLIIVFESVLEKVLKGSLVLVAVARSFITMLELLLIEVESFAKSAQLFILYDWHKSRCLLV